MLSPEADASWVNLKFRTIDGGCRLCHAQSMPKRLKNPDVVQNARRVFDEALASVEETTVSANMISLVMAELGRRGGRIGGKRRLVTMTAERRQEIARLAARKRWGKKTAKKVS